MFNGNESGFGGEIANNLEVSLQGAYGNLIAASKSDDFLPKMAAIFGGSGNLSRLQALSDTWASGDFSQLPTIQVLSSNLMNGANGAFSELTRTIYLSSDYLFQSSSNPAPLTGGITGVLLEEIGHFMDTLINPGSDTAGDEGELFAATLMGLPLSDAERLLINSEDDHNFVTIDNKAIAVEQSLTLPTITVKATDASATETNTGQTANPGQFILTRTGNTAAALTLKYTLSGTAANGTDYSKLDGKVTFAAGSATALVNVKPIDDTLLEGNETVILALVTGTGYTTGTAKTATVTIANTDPRGLADFLWDTGKTVSQIGVNLKNRGFDLPTIADALDDGVTKSDGTGLNYTDVALGLWNSGLKIDSRILADTLWDTGASQSQIGQALNYGIGRTLLQIASDMKYGVTKSDGKNFNYTDVAIGLWNSGLQIDSRILADILWDTGASQSQIGQALNYGIGRTLLQIASDMKYGVTLSDGKNFGYTDVAIGLWNSGLQIDSRILADILWDTGASQSQIGQALKSVGISLEGIADALDDGVTKSDGTGLNYTDVAIGLWNSGHKIDTRKLADLLWDEGATEIKIAQALNYGIGRNLLQIASDIKYGVTKSDGTSLNYTGVAIGLWNSGHKIDTRFLADLLWDTGASQSQIGQALNYGIGRTLLQIASDMKYGVTKSDGKNLSYTDVAIGLWNSGLKIDSRIAADILWDTGASQSQIGQALNYGIGRTLLQIASDMKYGVTLSDGKNLSYTDVAIGLWNSGLKIDTRFLADLLWDTGASQSQIGQALNYGIGRTLLQIASDIKYGVTKSDGTGLNYTDVAIGLWNSGLKIDTRFLADLLWDTGALQSQIGQALNYGIGRTLLQIASDMKYGVTLSDGKNLGYTDVAIGLWNSGLKIDSRILADILWDTGASQSQIGSALKSVRISLKGIADALDDGVTNSDGTGLSYIDVAIGLWNSGHSIDTRVLADLLWDEGATVIDIAEALNYGIGRKLAQIASDIKYGVTKSDGKLLNYTSVAIGLWNSGHSIDTRILADLLWDTGATQGEIAQALNFAIGRDLTQIASDMKYGVTLSNGKSFNYYDIANGLWDSGLANTRDIARELQNLGANAVDTAQVLHYQLDSSLEVIADALDDGATFSYRDVADGIWNSGHGLDTGKLAKLLRDEGASWDIAVAAIDAVTSLNWLQASWEVTRSDVTDWFNNASKTVAPVFKKLETFYEDNKSTLLVVAPALVISIEATKVIAKSIESGNIAPIVDVLKKIPVAGTAVGIIEGVINAIEGDERGVLISAINSALNFYGASTAITPKMVEFAVDILWELKDKDYQGAVSETLNNLGLQKTVAEVFVSVAWAMEKGNWETAVNAALTKVGFGNAKEFVNIAWDVIDKNYQGVLKTGLELVGLNALGIDQVKADAFINVTVAIRDGNFNKAADYLISLAGKDASQINQRTWIKDLRDGNPANDRQAIQTGLSELGFKNATQWVDTIWAVKDGQYLNALSGVLSLGKFKDAQDWLKIINNLQKENYLDALSAAFKLAKFQDGQSLAEAAIAVREGEFIDAFYESFDLIEGGSDLKDAFKALKEFDLQEFVTSMKDAAPLLLKVLV